MTAPRYRRVLVTGAAGMLGSAVVANLTERGYDIHGVDLVASPSWDGTHRFTEARLQEWAALEEAVAAADYIVHTAAITNLDTVPEADVFQNNVTGTSRLAFAAAASKARRLVYASSQSSLGFSRALTIVPPDYVPVDEEHPCHVTEGYGLSKLVGEQICKTVAYRFGLSTVSLRFPVIWAPERFEQHVAKRRNDPVQAAKSMWSYVDVRDAARAVVLSLDAELSSDAVINVTAQWPFCDGDIGALVRENYGSVEIRGLVGDNAPVYSGLRAEKLLGFRARYRWTAERIVDNGQDGND